MKSIFLIFLFLGLSSCSTMGPVSMGSGERSGFSFSSCSPLVLGFPVQDEHLKLDYVLSERGLTNEDVFAIDARSWGYLLPFYASRCLDVSLNKSGQEKMAAQYNPWKNPKDCKDMVGVAKSNCFKKKKYSKLRKSRKSKSRFPKCEGLIGLSKSSCITKNYGR